MIELLLEAERAVTHGRLDRADTLYWQIVERDPHNSIAVVGLARVALERDDERTALEFARRALVVDPDNVAAQRLVTRLEEVLAYRPGPTAPAQVRPTQSALAPQAPASTVTVDEPEPRSRFGRLFGRG